MKQISFVVDINDEDDISKITITGDTLLTSEDVATCMSLLYLDVMETFTMSIVDSKDVEKFTFYR